ncbi:MAG: DUF2179 domain-containing protein [Bacilli bacterium]|nr:DUF2179 domain-containing protein [Bacilli bacterium]
MIYLGIFLFKILEDSLTTLRLIVVNNGKKAFGAILQFICTIIWVILTGSVLINFTKDPFKIVAFAFGGLVGSFLGSVLEERIALGTNLVIIKTKKFLSLSHKFKYFIITIDKYFFIFIIIPRRKMKKITRYIHNIDNEAFIMAQKIKLF